MWKSLRQQACIKDRSYEVQDYRTYTFSAAEWVLYLLEGGILIYLLGKFFYDSVVAMACLSPLMIVFLKYQKSMLCHKQKYDLRMQFKDAVVAVATNQKAGYSVENAFREAYTDMRMLYGDKSIICKELQHIIRGLENNVVLEKMLLSLGVRSDLEDIREFAEVFAIAKRNGGNLTGVISTTAGVIEEKTEVEQEIKVMISAKKMESNIMSVIPFLIIFYMDATSDGFFDCLYHNVTGIAVMSICLAIYAAAFFLAQKIVKIEV